MGLEKAIEHGKEKRQPYWGSKSFDRTCRNHGDCPYCREGRMRKQRLLLQAADADKKEGEAT